MLAPVAFPVGLVAFPVGLVAFPLQLAHHLDGLPQQLLALLARVAGRIRFRHPQVRAALRRSPFSGHDSLRCADPAPTPSIAREKHLLSTLFIQAAPAPSQPARY